MIESLRKITEESLRGTLEAANAALRANDKDREAHESSIRNLDPELKKASEGNGCAATAIGCGGGCLVSLILFGIACAIIPELSDSGWVIVFYVLAVILAIPIGIIGGKNTTKQPLLEKITEHQEELAKSERQRPALEQAVSSATQELDEFLRQSSAWRTNGSATGAEKPAAAPAEKLHEVTSPIVGTFFDSASPGKPTFVKIGDHVEVGQVLCIVEAMNLMNEIVSDVAGEVVKRIAASGQPVENGQPLFAIRPR